MLNEKKICFITCVNDEQMYEESLLYLERLVVPDEITVEFIAVRQAMSMTSAYNEAMQKSDAKYKVYLHQDVLLIERNFIVYLLNIFKNSPAVGLLGIVGTSGVDLHGIWWNSENLLGMIYDNNTNQGEVMLPYLYENGGALFMPANAIDGVLMATQYDVAWRDDIFTGWHFYDLSHCMEFKKKGYEVGVARQDSPWLIHLCGSKQLGDSYTHYRISFLREYKEMIFPLVSVLIPTYNRPEYFQQALESARAQTYPNIEIIVCDNSTDERTAELMKQYEQDWRIRYFRNQTAVTKKENFNAFEKLVRGEYIQWLMDDDLLFPAKIKKMVQCFLNNRDVTLVTSARKWIDGDNQEIPHPPEINFGCADECIMIGGSSLGNKIIVNMRNLIGEPSAFLFKKDDLTNHYWNADCRGYQTISDVVMGLELLEKGNCAFFQTPLNGYRRHAEQEGQQADTVILSRVEWLRLLEEYEQKGCFNLTKEDYHGALKHWLIDAKELLGVINRSMLSEGKMYDRYLEQVQNIESYVELSE